MKGPLFQAYLLKWSPTPFLLTLRGPNSAAAPYPTEEHPGPSKLQFHKIIKYTTPLND